MEGGVDRPVTPVDDTDDDILEWSALKKDKYTLNQSLDSRNFLIVCVIFLNQ